MAQRDREEKAPPEKEHPADEVNVQSVFSST